MITLFIVNDPSCGPNITVNSTGNQVTYFFKPSIVLDDKKKYEIRLVSASIVYCTPNIDTSNNKFVYTTSDHVTHTFTFDTGLYSYKDINMAISLFTMGSSNGNNANLFAFVPDENTSKFYVCFNTANVSINCATSTIMQTLGFPISMGTIGNFNYAGGYVKGTSRANLNPIQSFLVQTNITTGNYLGSDASSIIASVPIDVAPFSTCVFSPVHPIRTLINVKRIDQLTVTILDQFGDPVDLGSNGGQDDPEPWSAVLSITEASDIVL